MFNGLPRGTIEFFQRLKENNNREWWSENRAFYDQEIRPSFTAMLDALGSEYQPWRIYRPHNNTRFSRNKPPYKIFLGGVTMMESGTGHFVQVRPTGLLIGSGYAMMAKDQLAKFREVVAEDETGSEFYDLVARAENIGIAVSAGRYERLTGAPKGCSRSHPRIHWLRAKGAEVSTRLGSPDWLYRPAAVTEILGVFDKSKMITDWLDAHVGPSSMTPEEIWAPRKS